MHLKKVWISIFLMALLAITVAGCADSNANDTAAAISMDTKNETVTMVTGRPQAIKLESFSGVEVNFPEGTDWSVTNPVNVSKDGNVVSKIDNTQVGTFNINIKSCPDDNCPVQGRLVFRK